MRYGKDDGIWEKTVQASVTFIMPITHKDTDRQVDRQINKTIDRQMIDRQIDRQIDLKSFSKGCG